ncbi:MAG: hypothetical protein KF708_12215 [Pirellulales bacterium]|nr:hypothetical protein [Pirellulales bacterium]
MVDSCHELHYLQMATEKLAKAYFWKTNQSPMKSHSAFVRFMKALVSKNTSKRERDRIANVLGFKRFSSFRTRVYSILPRLHELERMAPALAGDDGPNAEYPWPRNAPQFAPANFRFNLIDWTESAHGRQLMNVLQRAIERFPQYA